MSKSVVTPMLLAIIGPTAVGKTALALLLARALNAEIVSADSRQVYVGMDIATGKPTADELCSVPHHLINVIRPDQWMTLAAYQQMAYDSIEKIFRAGKLPILVGGTGQYVHAVLNGWRIPETAPEFSLRNDMEQFASLYGSTALHEKLRDIDQSAASRIDARNVRRTIRALELHLPRSAPLSNQRKCLLPACRIVKIGLTRDRSALYQQIDNRVEIMLEKGLVGEITRLIASGFEWTLPSMSSLGYIQMRPFIEGTASLDFAVQRIKRDTRRLVRKQYGWFRLSDPAITWFDADRMTPGEILRYVQEQILMADLTG